MSSSGGIIIPYIKKELREKYYKSINDLVNILSLQNKDIMDGQVNFVITSIIKRVYTPDSYEILNRAVGVLESIKLEYYRRVVVPYEENKIRTSGDV